MSGLVDQLNKLIREQAEAAAAEQRRLAAVAAAKARAQAEAQALALARKKERAEKAERERLAAQKAHPGVKPAPFKPDPIDADEPKVAAQPVEAKPDPAAARPADIALAPVESSGAFASLRGKMNAPVNGKVVARFGAKRDEVSWKGVFINTAEGAEVRAVAAGRVVVAKYMRGFGNLVVIAHGTEYLTVYGNNQALLKHVGDAVKAGESIASAGNTGGNEESGLYFELRFQGKALDPASWIKF
jgi:septal ring factor EnvC (AmiA/AmiB activator)